MVFVNVAICDSENIICEDIKNLIQKINPVASTKIFRSKSDILDSSEEFDIYILDIKGVDGLNIARNLRNRQSKSVIIFLTGYREYMEAAFDVNAFHYLIKPVEPERFANIFNRAVNEVTKHKSNHQIILKVGEDQHVIKINDILYVESSNKKIIYHTSKNIYETYGTMDQAQRTLGNNFYRCHRCYLVNLTKIIAYNSQSIKLINGEEILLAQKKYHDFIKIFMCFVK